MNTITIRCPKCGKAVGFVAALLPSTQTANRPCYDCENTERLRREATARHQATKAGRN
jgi:predicted RNA-binding Zn-ribbon protein involved in translation (DUF1610 family)